MYEHTFLFSGRGLPAQDTVIQMLAYCLWALNRAMEIFDGGGILLSRRESREASMMMQHHLKAYQFLATSHGTPCSLFRMRPKSHYLYHTARQVERWRINPSLFHNFEEESWLGRCKRIAIHCHGKTMTTRVLQRYLICLALYVENFRRICRKNG